MSRTSSRWLCPSDWLNPAESSPRRPTSPADPLDSINLPVLSPLSPRWSLVCASALATPKTPSPPSSTPASLTMQPAAMPSTPDGARVPLSFKSLQAVTSSPQINHHSVLSTTSTVSFGSTASVSSSVAQRRFWSPSPSLPSAPSSPPSGSSPTSPVSPSFLSSPSPLPRSRRSRFILSHRTTYIPPLIDTAARTRPWQSSIASLVADLHWLAHAAPKVVAARPTTSITATAEAFLQTALALLMVSMLVFLPLLWACLPGVLWTVWLGFFFASAWLLSALLNGGPIVAKPWDERTIQAVPDETWLFVSGMGESSRSLAKTLPRLAAVCGRPVTLVRPGRSYGLAFDFVITLAHRWLPGCLPSPAVTRLHRTLHAALAGTRHNGDGMSSRVVVLAHNSGAATVARALPLLLADVPSAWLARLEIYTFGSLAPDFVLPPTPMDANIPCLPHVEHFALTQDPCARFGLLRSIRERDVRFCGSVAVLGEKTGVSAHWTPTSALRPLLLPLCMEDYLTALFGPEPWSMRPDVNGVSGEGCMRNTCFLDAAVCVDRELVERREIPCPVDPVDPMTCFSFPTAGAPRCFSWTGLGATAAGARRDVRKHDADILQDLEVARRYCRAYDGHCGREVSRLASYYAEAVLWHQERFGPPGFL